MLVRLPSAERYAQQVEKAFSIGLRTHWVGCTDLKLFFRPSPCAIFPISIPVFRIMAPIENLCDIVESLAEFLLSLQRINPTDGPLAGPHSFYCGGTLTNYHAQLRRTLDILKEKIRVDIATEIWEEALAIAWKGSPMWVRGDISPGNLLIKEKKLSAVIDFGQLAVGDPACDLTIAWTFLKGESRELFRSMFQFDASTWTRARAWTLWKFMIAAAGLTSWNAFGMLRTWEIIEEVLAG